MEAEPEREINFISVSFSSFDCLSISLELLLTAQTLTSRGSFIS